MRFSVNTQTLKDWLNIVNHATASITTTPILENILIKANFKSLVLTSNNLEMAIEHVITDGINIEVEWAFSIPSKIFSNYIWLINDDKVSIELLTDDSLQIKTATSDIKIKWIEASEFPLIPPIKETNSFEINTLQLKKSIEKTLFSTAEWNIRPTLAWIYVSLKWQNIIFASTDSFRLSEYSISAQKDSKDTYSQIIPSKTAFELSKIISDDKSSIKITIWENQIAFTFENTKVFSRLLNWKFPDYSSFFPKWYATKWTINRLEFMQALKKVNLISKENNYSIQLSLSQENWILLETSETQIWEWTIEVDGNVEGEENIIWINSIYMLEVLGVLESSHISISFETPLSPIMIVPEFDKEENKATVGTFNHIIMPLKI